MFVYFKNEHSHGLFVKMPLKIVNRQKKCVLFCRFGVKLFINMILL